MHHTSIPTIELETLYHGSLFENIPLTPSQAHKTKRPQTSSSSNMAPDKLVPNDSRVKTETAQLRGKTYKYIVGEPEGTPLETMVLIHGFPDLGFGWRYQVPYFMSLGFRVIVPDMLGYGGSEAPESLEHYTYKSLSADINELARKYVGKDGQIILGGHDWGGMIVWKVASWYPELIKGVFSVCTPYVQPRETFIPLEKLIEMGHLLNFRYQLQFKGPDVESRLQGEEKIRQFLNALYGGRTPDGQLGFSTKEGVFFDKLPELTHSPLVSKDELDFYAKEYALQKAPELRGPLNYYRTQELNQRDDVEIAKKEHKFEMPALFITATDDAALPPAMSQGMDSSFTNLTREEVKASHWALWQAADAVNQDITKWLDGVLGGVLKAKASL
jgi:soluble epoxide hydrolase/lipid-phosphate phosphatase